ncbi:MAG: leucine-rich repeat domain-containing protein, partial [Clostridiales bacterium]|nr:leucine-rich repeat domain-containing protein [Clostridiales bacterium]
MKHIRKRLTALLLALAMCLSMLSVSAWAAEPEAEEEVSLTSEESEASEDATILDSGTCGDDLTWTLDSDYALTISGTGAMTDWSSGSKTPWYSYRSSISSVTIGDGVTSIGSRAFYSCTGMTVVTIPDSVTS